MAERICSAEGCDRQRRARGLCGKHYQRFVKHGSPDVVQPKGRPAANHSACEHAGCSEPFYSRGLCSSHYQKYYRSGEYQYLVRALGCAVDGCNEPHQGRGYCASHYFRLVRTGSPVRTFFAVGQPAGKYARVYVPGHPLAQASGSAYKHRVVLYDQIGPGAHPCHWCGSTVLWEMTFPQSVTEALVVDHLDLNKSNNDPANLVPSCGRCNVSRQPAVQAGWQG